MEFLTHYRSWENNKMSHVLCFRLGSYELVIRWGLKVRNLPKVLIYQITRSREKWSWEKYRIIWTW